MYVLDTNSVLYLLKGRGGVGKRLLATPRTAIAVPAVVLYELEVGTRRSASPERRRQQLLDLVGPMRVLPFDEPEASVAARIRVELERAGEPIGPMDTLIAATALRQGATLVTHNVGEFARVDGLTVEDWY